MKFPNPCCRCGFCCLSETCPIGQAKYSINRFDLCPGLTFNGDIATCLIVEKNPGLIPIGDGCCIKATAYAKGVGFDFAALPSTMKKELSRKIRYGY